MKKYTLTRINQTGSISAALDEARFSINYAELLNPAQYEAVKSVDGTYLIIAGAGTGKTRTLVYRVARLIELGYDPQSILLLTFTRKSATEMLNRASLILDNRCSKILGGTFHSFANVTLRKYSKAVGLENNFTILDQSDSEDVINLIRSQSGLISKEKRFPNKRTLGKIFSLNVNTEISIKAIVEDDYPHFRDDLEEILKVSAAYKSYKRKNNLLDYDDLLIYLKIFLQELSPAAKSLLSKLNFVMIDEFQDTNKLQNDIVKGLTQLNNNLMVVGDDSQSIYAFRGANFKNIIDFPSQFSNVKIITLEENFRSTQPILNFANRIVDASLEKFPKNLFTHKKSSNVPMIVAALTENLQSKFVVDKILELREEGIPLKEICVLFRSSFFSFDLEIELSKANLPFQKFGGMKFVETAHVKDVLAFLRIIFNNKDLVSWFRVLLLHEGIGQKSAQKIIDEISENQIDIKQNPEGLKTKKIFSKVSALFELLHSLQSINETPTEKAQKIIEYYSPIFQEKFDDYNKRKKDLDIFLNITEKYRSLESLISDMSIDPPIDSFVDLGDESSEDEFVTLSTIHSAKGLEWHSVFVIHALDGYFPSNRSAYKIETLEEERRLMYVAVTRAKNNLMISYPMNIYDRETGTTLSKPSRFISDVTGDLAEGYLLEE
ncbi:MAG: ATP-dependent helicase [Chlorobiaceae bacterium]|nr:ATP-dependent helicase [Chlorobiaceae bacterium]MBA4308773.1 ATP-dependent helicase [Chlorobiaceae bacterium]